MATFDYTPVAGVHPLWGLRVEDKDGEAPPDGPIIGCVKLSEVEAEIEQQVIEHQIGPDRAIQRITGEHGWRKYEFVDGSVMRFAWEQIMRDFRCKFCGFDTHAEGYMVHDSVWAAAGLPYDVGWVCVGCVERRLGRQLNAADFSDVPMNTDRFQRRTQRLTDRLRSKSG